MYPDKPVALVESEKCAVICAGLMPRFLWLATGGKSQINDRLLVLKGTKVVAFLDVDGFTEWTERLLAIPGLNVTIADVLQKEATPQEFLDHIDIADWLLRYMFGPPPARRDALRLDAEKQSRSFSRMSETAKNAAQNVVQCRKMGQGRCGRKCVVFV